VTDIHLPDDLPGTVAAALERAVARFGAIEAVADEGTRWTYAELFARVDRAARALVASGVEPGDRVAIWCPNIADWVVVASAVHRVGAVLVPLNTRFKGPEAAHVLGASGARLLFTVTDFLGNDHVELLGDRSDLADLAEVVVVLGPDRGDTTSWSTFLERAGAVDPEVTAARAAAIRPEDTSDILFTSGTTGAPKGAMLAHGASVRAFATWAALAGLVEGDRYLVVNPFFHSFGLKAGILACFLSGATIVPHAVFDVPAVMRKVEDERITVLPGPPAIYQSILDRPDPGELDLSSLRVAVTGAAAVPVELIRRMRSELTFRTILTAYGLTEATGFATMCRSDDDSEVISATSGRAIPGVEVAVVDDEGRFLAPGEAGEIVVRGYVVMQGYFRNDAATAATVDADGWLHTGDVGVLDEAGNLRITDRIKDLFIVGGFNAYPAEIEGMVLRHPAVAQVAVVGVPDGRLGEVGAAFVVPRAGASVEPGELISWCREQMANYKVPRHVVVVESLPMNASNKVLKFELRERAAAELADD
jgi:HIP---CoA ligase